MFFLVSGCAGLKPLSHSFSHALNADPNIPQRARKASVRVVGVDSQQWVKSFCSGVIIGPHTILTAAHCIDGDGLQLRILFGHGIAVTVNDSRANIRYADIAAPEDTVLTAVSQKRHPELDLAVIVVAEKLESNVTLHSTDINLSENHAIGFSGFGLFNQQLGQYRQGVANVVYLEGAYIWIDSGVDAICLGDSGGGIYKKGQLIGLIVSGSASCKRADRFVLLEPERAWILAQ